MAITCRNFSICRIPPHVLTCSDILHTRFYFRLYQENRNKDAANKKHNILLTNKPSAPAAEKPVHAASVRPVGWAIPTEKPVHAPNPQLTNTRPLGWVYPTEKPINLPVSQSTNTRPIGWVPPAETASIKRNKNTNLDATSVQHNSHVPSTAEVPKTATNLGYGQNNGGHSNIWNHGGFPPSYQPSPTTNVGYGQNNGGYGNTWTHGFPPYHSSHVNYGPITYMQNSGYTPYHYTSRDYDSGIYGLFIGYALGNFLSTPTYYSPFHSSYSTHYVVHHYYHNRESVPQELKLAPNVIVDCARNVTVLCSSNTVALCLANGTIMCVAKAQETEPCHNDPKVYCIKTAVPCFNKTLPGCESKNETAISLPCISKTTLENSSYVNGSLVTGAAADSKKFMPDGTLMDSSLMQLYAGKSNDFCITLIAEPAVNQQAAGSKNSTTAT